MEGRCAVETWAQFGNVPSRAKVTGGTLVFICDGSDEVNIFHIDEKRIMTTLQFPGPICYLVQSEDKHLIYAACESAVYCVNIPILKSSRIPTGSAPAPSLSISSDWLAVREERVCSLLLVGSILLTLTQKDRLWQFTLYKVPASVESSASGHEKLVVLELPVVSSGLYEDGDQRTPARKSVLNCVHSSDAVPTSSSPSSPSPTLTIDGHLLLEPLLFKMIFGVDAALTKSPIILCGLPDGRLCFFPLRGRPSRVRVLHSLEQPIVFIGSTVAMGTDPPLPQSLVAVGGLGRVVLIHTGGTAAAGTTAAMASGAGQKTLAFTEGCVPGPVVCGCVEGRRLYYSTHSDVLVLNLSSGPKQQGAMALREGEDVGDGLPSPVSLNVCGVVALGRATHTAAAAAAGAVQLLALSARGRLQSITVPKEASGGGGGGGGAQGRELTSLPSSQVGQRIKDLLAAIGDVCERATVLKASIHSKTEVLRQLNQVLHISGLLLSDHNKEDHLPVQERPIRCQTLSQWSRVLQRDTLNLTCVLQNMSPYVLEQGWTFCVTLHPLSHPLGEGSSRTLSFPILDLGPGGEFEVSLPLATAGDTSFPVTVRCSLVFMVARLLAEEKLAALLAGGPPDPSLPGLAGGCFSLPVDTLTVDWLDALRVCKPGDGNKDGGFPPTEGASVDPLQAFLDVREVVGRGRSGDTGGTLRSKARGGHSACVRVSQQSLSAALEWAAAGAAPRGSKVAPSRLSLSSAVLDWLLPSPGPGGEGTATRAGDHSVVSARCPGGRPVRLTAKEVTVGKQGAETGGGGLKALEIWVEGPSMAAVCGLHHAVLGRVQTLLQRAPENRASPGWIQSAVLRQAIQKAEAVLQRIQESRVPEGSGGDFTREKMNQSLLSVYRELRDNPLLIV